MLLRAVLAHCSKSSNVAEHVMQGEYVGLIIKYFYDTR